MKNWKNILIVLLVLTTGGASFFAYQQMSKASDWEEFGDKAKEAVVAHQEYFRIADRQMLSNQFKYQDLCREFKDLSFQMDRGLIASYGLADPDDTHNQYCGDQAINDLQVKDEESFIGTAFSAQSEMNNLLEKLGETKFKTLGGGIDGYEFGAPAH